MAGQDCQAAPAAEQDTLLEQQQGITAGTLRQYIAHSVPVLGPLCGNTSTPTFECVGKLLEVLALIQGLLMSCFAGNVGQHLKMHDDESDYLPGPDQEAQRFLSFAFDFTALALLFTMVTYAYLVFLINGDDNSPQSAKEVRDFWQSGGKLILVGIVLLTVGGAGFYAKFVWQTIYSTTDKLRDIHWVPYAAVAGVLFIHLSFSKTLKKRLNGA
uniref:Uncharacterized protein n=1 Tax=Alexandrium andersonii TaxID=327968 RepID=A0A7S2CUF5_9DINO